LNKDAIDELYDHSDQAEPKTNAWSAARKVRESDFPNIIPSPPANSVLHYYAACDKTTKSIFEAVYALQINNLLECYPGVVKNPHSPRAEYHLLDKSRICQRRSME